MMRYEKAWIGMKVRHISRGVGIIKGFKVIKDEGFVIIMFEGSGRQMRQPYPESFFDEDTYTLDPNMKQRFLMLNSQEWQDYRASLSAVKNETLFCERCNQPIKARAHTKLIFKQRNVPCLCQKCSIHDRNFSLDEIYRRMEQLRREERKERRQRIDNDELDFSDFRNMMRHDKPRRSTKSRMHPTDGMNLGDW